MAAKGLQVPQAVSAQLVDKSKGKTRDINIKMTQKETGNALFVEIFEAKDSNRAKWAIDVRQAICEMKTANSLEIITTDQEFEIVFGTTSDALSYYNFIDAKSVVQGDNKAMEQLDEDMRLIWPFPGGSFF